MEYRIIVREVISKAVCIEAENEYGAMEEAQRMYDNGEIDMEREVDMEFEITCECQEVQSGQAMLNGSKVDFEACVNLMDSELREDVHMDLAPCTEQEFLDEYADRHLEKYGEAFTI